MGTKPFFRRRKVCPFSGDNAPKIDYKDTRLLQRYISERGKIVPSRITAVSAKKHRFCRRVGSRKILTHTDGLSPLTWKNKCPHFDPLSKLRFFLAYPLSRRTATVYRSRDARAADRGPHGRMKNQF